MDVKCERCSTEYEFDDALVSGRGTTVKCTNCGHKFKIRRTDGDFSEDFWNITTGDGRTLVFTSLRELQRAIQGFLVERNDRLSRGGLPPKAIGQIPELAPFFEQREAAKQASQARSVKTQDGLGPAPPPAHDSQSRQRTKPEFPAPPSDPLPVPPPAAVPPPPPAGKATLIGTGPASDIEAFPGAADPLPVTQRQPDAPALPASELPPAPAAPLPRAPLDTMPMHRPLLPNTDLTIATTLPLGGASELPPAPESELPVTPVVSHPPPTPRVSSVPPRTSKPPPLPSKRPSSARMPAAQAASERQVPAAAPERQVPAASEPRLTPDPFFRLEPDPDPEPAPAREARRPSLRAQVDDDDRRGPSSSVLPDGPQSRRRRSAFSFIVVAALVGAGLMLAAVWAQKNLGAQLNPPASAAKPPVDPRVATFLGAGEKALADGNLELAKESFDKASALSEKDARVLLGLARLAALRADGAWLKARLLPADAADEQRIAKDALAELAASARRAAEEAALVAPEDASALRAKVDALRIAGERDAARALVGKIAAVKDQPETAYVLAALDLVDAEPLWSTVLERLRAAAAAETGPGRARATLVYALARSGDAPGARAELDRLAALPKAHPLLPLLRGAVERTTTTRPTKDAGAPVSAAVETADAGKHAAAAMPSDPRELVTRGEKARAKGDYEKARGFYNAAVEKNPNDSEALAGLAAIAYAQRDLAAARASYKRVLAINPNYMPALIGLADVEWDSGDKATATKMYKDIVDRYPPGAYPARVQQRSEGG